MIINDSLLQLMLREDMTGNEMHISHRQVKNPARIELQADEIVYVAGIKVFATKSYSLDFYSATESRLIQQEVRQPEIIEHRIVSRHKGSIHFRINTEDDFEVNYVRLKIIS